MAVIFAIIALPLSFKSLEQGKFALQLNWTTQKISDEVVTSPGMYMVGLGNMLIEFPSTFQNMYFVKDSRGIAGSDLDVFRGPIRARSADGLEMLVSLSFQWKLEPTALVPLYRILGGGEGDSNLYRDEFVRFARAAIIESCSYFEADMYFTNRTEITRRMRDIVSTEFDQPAKGLKVLIKGLQLREVDLPDAFDEEIVRTQEQMQEVEVANAEREEEKITWSRELLVAEQRVLEILEKSRGIAQKTKDLNEATVDQLLVFQTKQAQANALILEEVSKDADPVQRLFEIMEISAVRNHNSSHLMINL